MAGVWPALDGPNSAGTREHLRLWSQLLGKTALAYASPVNHWWHVALHVSSRGLATGTLPAPDDRVFGLELDFVGHRLVASTSDGQSSELPLEAGSLSSFYERYLDLLRGLGLHPHLWPRPVEGEDATAFDEDHRERPYDARWAENFFSTLREMNRLMTVFRGAFLGKASPAHFFWGSFDLATTRFSGRRAPRHPGGVPNCPDYVPEEAYSHECASAGFWPGGGGYPDAALYSYVYPEPAGFREASLLPDEAFYSPTLREFLLPYDAVRTSADPDRAVLSFLQSSYAAAADHGHWDRAALERTAGEPRWLGDGSWATSANISSLSCEHQPL